MPKRRRLSDIEEIHVQLRIQSTLLAALTWQRTGVRPRGFDHLALPDPFARLVPYARAQVALLEYTARALHPARPTGGTS
jgi:hypothetical protein